GRGGGPDPHQPARAGDASRRGRVAAGCAGGAEAHRRGPAWRWLSLRKVAGIVGVVLPFLVLVVGNSPEGRWTISFRSGSSVSRRTIPKSSNPSQAFGTS